MKLLSEKNYNRAKETIKIYKNMGTNYYGRIIPTADEKQKLIDAINDDNPTLVKKLTHKLYGSRDEYIGEGNIIHLGKRSGGWKFLWNPNVIEAWDNETHEYKPKYIYPLTKKGITDFCMREDVVIYDDYGRKLDSKEFLDMAFNWCLDGLDSKEYHTNPKYKAPSFYGDSERQKLWKQLGYKVEYYDFYSDGLLFSTSTSFG